MSSAPMNYLKRIHISVFLTCFIMLGTILSVAQAAEQTRQDVTDTKNYWKPTGSITSGSSSAKEEDIYIDDEQIEGSGGRGEIHDDLEKDAEYSGSGYGPDDEDSTSRKLYSPNSNSNLNKNNNDRSKVQEQDLGGAGSGDDKLDNDDEDYGEEGDSDIGFDNNDLDSPTTDHDDEDDSFLPTIAPSGEVISVVGNVTTTELNINRTIHDNDNVERPDADNDDATQEEAENDYEDSLPRFPVRQNPASTNNKDSKEVSRINPETDSGADLDIDESGNPIIPGTSDKTSDSDSTKNYNEVFIMNTKGGDDRPTSFFAQPGILAAVIGGAVVGLLCAILVVMFIVYRMRKKDEGSYALDEPKRSPAANSYAKNANNREFYA